MNGFFRDLKFGVRLFAKGRLVTTIVIVTLALGIGVTSTIVSLVGTVLVAPFPNVVDPKTVVWMFQSRGEVDRSRDDVSVVDYLRWKVELQSLESIAAFAGRALTVEEHGEPEAIQSGAVSANYFRLLGTRIALGRDFEDGEDTAGHDHVVILNHSFAERRFGEAAAALGQTLSLSGTPHTVIGVLPVSFAFPQAFPAFVPLVFTPEMRASRNPSIVVIGRRKPGVTTAVVDTELGAVSQKLGEEFPDTHRGASIAALSLPDVFIGKRGRAISLLTLLAAMLMLGIAAINVGNVLLAQGAARRAEIAIRAALGASRARIMLQLLTECLFLCVVGGTLGTLVAIWGLHLFMASMPERLAMRMQLFWDLRFDAKWTAVAAGLTLFVTLVAGLLPAWRLSETNVGEAFKEQGTHATVGKGQRRLLKILVTGQVAVALTLLSGAVWALLDLARIEGTRLGLDPTDILTADIERHGQATRAKEQEIGLANLGFFRDLLRQASVLPGVTAAALASRAPLERGFEELRLAVPGRPPRAPGDPLWSALSVVAGDYFGTLRIAVLEGRVFTPQDDADRPAVVVLSRRAAELIFPGERAIGRTLLLEEKTPSTVVGVVDDVVAYHHEEVGMVYLPLAQRPVPDLAILLRGGDARHLERSLRDVVREKDPHQAISRAMPLSTHVDEHLWGPRTMVRLVAIPGTLAVLLALLGIYGLAAYSANQRRSELGIRAALGASPRALVALVMREALFIAGIGSGVGLALSIVLVGALGDASGQAVLSVPQTIGLATSLFAVVVVASYGPAKSASRVSPALAIRPS